MELISWEELQERKQQQMCRFQPSGVACPQCGEELLADTMVVLATYPPRYSYYCAKCKWHGTA